MTIPYEIVPHPEGKLAPMIDGHEVHVDVDEPALLPAQIPPPVWRTILLRSIVVLMVGCVGMMLFFGIRQFNPMMLMGVLMLLAMLGGGAAGALGGKNPQGELDLERTKYATHLREQRRNAHVVNRHIHTLQTSLYPHPDSLLARCGKPKAMWAMNQPTNKAAAARFADGREQAESVHTSAWGCARIGVGYRRAEPYIKPKANAAPEDYEPVQAAAYMRFIRTQNVITNCPIGIDVFRRPFIVCMGDPDRLLQAARAMICSLATNHAPKYLQLGIITDELAEWDWMKWLPHSVDHTRRDIHGAARLHWPSIAAYADDQHATIKTPTGLAVGGTPTDKAVHRVIFVDIPGKAPNIPEGISPSAGLAGHTFVYIRHSG